MKRLLLLLLACLMLTGCRTRLPAETESRETAGTRPSEAATEEETEETLPPPKENILLDGAEPDENGLYVLKTSCLEGVGYPQCHTFGDDLLVGWFQNLEGSEEGYYCLRLIDLADGEILAQREFTESSYYEPQIRGNRIVMTNPFGGSVLLLNEGLETLQSWTREPGEGPWYVGNEPEILYDFSGRQLLEVNLASGRERDLLEQENALQAGVLYQGEEGVCFNLLRKDSCLMEAAFLNYDTGLTETVPQGERLLSYSRAGELWMGDLTGDYTCDFLGTGDQVQVVESGNKILSLTEDGRLLCVEDSRYSVYNRDGTLEASCVPTDHDSSYCTGDVIWSGDYGGYFLIRLEDNGPGELLFWDASAASPEGESLTLLSLEDYDREPVGQSVDPALYGRARELSQKYGVKIKIADECSTEYLNFQAQLLENPQDITAALDLVDTALSRLPEGFMEQLCYGSYRSLEIHLVGPLTAGESYGNATGYGGFATQDRGHHLIVVNALTAYDGTYYHEISHILDSRLGYESLYREDCLYSEEKWEKLNPPGFAYGYDYSDYWENEDSRENEEWFLDAYAQVNSTEDRARIFENACSGADWAFYGREPLREKLSYYSACIRDSLDTRLWPERTIWEETLDKTAPK